MWLRRQVLRLGAIGAVVGGLMLVGASGVGAASNLTIAYGSQTVLPVTAGEANVVIDVSGAHPGSQPGVFGEDSQNTPFNKYTGTVPGTTPGPAYCTVVDANGDATCYISVPQAAVAPFTFFVTDQVELPTNQVPEVPLAAALPLLLGLAVPMRRWLGKRAAA